MRSLGKKAAILVTVAVMIIVVVFFEFFVFRTDPYFTAYYNEFNKTPTPTYDYDFSPPVSMYHALLIALESGGWNATSLQNMAIRVELDFCAFGPLGSFTQIYQVTSPPVDWSPQQVNDTTYRYVWTIIVHHSAGIQGIPLPYYFVDAATAELIVPILE